MCGVDGRRRYRSSPASTWTLSTSAAFVRTPSGRLPKCRAVAQGRLAAASRLAGQIQLIGVCTVILVTFFLAEHRYTRTVGDRTVEPPFSTVCCTAILRNCTLETK